jgi:hypothetical protein
VELVDRLGKFFKKKNKKQRGIKDGNQNTATDLLNSVIQGL